MQMMSFIVLDENENPERGRSQKFATVNGEVYIPLDVSVPVIVKGTGCVGLGTVKELCIRRESTEIAYEFTADVSREACDAYYNLYRNQMTVLSSDDPYDNQDALIPGAMAGKKRVRNSYHESSRREPALSDFLDDDYTLDY